MRTLSAKARSFTRRLARRATASAHRYSRPLSRDRAVSLASEARALAELGREADAQAAYLRALDEPSRPDRPLARWHAELGRSFWRVGDLETARGHLESAVESEARPEWLVSMALVAHRQGDVAAAVGALRRIDATEAVVDPGDCLELAQLYSALGHWNRARTVLERLVERHPGHANAHRRLAMALRALRQWGGSFTELDQDRRKAAFAFDPAPRDRDLLRACRRAVQLDPRHPTWLAPLADALHQSGEADEAIATYERAVAAADQSDGKWTLTSKHRWQFRLERMRHQAGAPRVEDPLFECLAEPVRAEPPATVPGVFEARFTYLGLTIEGFLSDADTDAVEIHLDGRPIKTVNLSADDFLGGFGFFFKRPTLELFPASSELEVRTRDGRSLLTRGGGTAVALTVPHGDGRLSQLVESGTQIDKKGEIRRSVAETRERQQEYLRIYEKVRDHFEKEFGRSLFLMYGTLLGYHRSGDFIPTDDDFDAGYVTERTDPRSVKAEAQDLMVELIKAGFTVCINRQGKLFKIQTERGATDGYHLDLRPLWFQDGNLWVHNHCSYPSAPERFLPVEDGELRGVRVSVPRDTEHFLANHYGPGWRVPDPGFTYYADEVDPLVRARLTAALITPSEIRALYKRVEAETAGITGAGRLVGIGMQDLYPLDQFIF